MEKNKIKKFAINARKHLRESVIIKLANLGISENKVNSPLSISTADKKYYVDGRESNALTGAQISWREDIVSELKKHNYEDDPKTAFNDFVEEVAYTWFNRIIAIRFMEVNNYLPSRVRVLSSEEGKAEPDIINEALDIEGDLGRYSESEKKLITQTLTDRTPELMDKLYAVLFIKQCDALSEILPALFEKTRDYLKLLFVPHYDRGVIQDLINEIPESYFDVTKEGQVQIIGWLYQYYNSEPHDKVVKMNGKAIQKDEIPAATQLFTPDWIVKYMVDNSLGKYYLERHPDSSIKFDLKYLLPDKIKTVENNKEISEYKVLDNAMGSGHILVYAFDLLMKMYQEQGYGRRDAARKILENNIYGLEIDKRAFQLAYFSLMMKGRENDRRFLSRKPKINLYYFQDLHMSNDFYDLIDDAKVRKNLRNILADFSDATELGSIIKIDANIDIDVIKDAVENIHFKAGLDVFGNKEAQKQILKTLKIIQVMSNKYEVVVTNPPYLNKFDKTLKKYLSKNYKDYSKDLFSVFVYHNLHLLTKDGYAGYMTPFVWMFIKRYEPLRKNVINNVKIDSLIQMEYSAFKEATVPIDTFVLKNSDKKIGTYLRLSNFKGGMTVQEQKVLAAVKDPNVKYLYRTNQDNFNKIPGNPIAYWADQHLIEDFEKGKPLGDLVNAKVGLQTGNNKRFLRQWFEVAIKNISFNSHSIKESIKSGKKWFPINKGGSYRKWYGNYDYIVNWENNGYEIRHFTDKTGKLRSRPQNIEYYFRPAVTWSKITSSELSFRYRSFGSIHETAGNEFFSKNHTILIVSLALLNTKVIQYISNIMNATINSQISDILNLPFLAFSNKKMLTHLAKECISYSKQDWDTFETSWDFKRSPLLTEKFTTLNQSFDNWSKQALDRFNQLKTNEEELNRIFINLYSLQGELTPEEDDKEVCVHKADQVRDIKAFLSYFIGCVFGRYSLDQDGLIFAGGKWDASLYKTFKPNQDNLILLTNQQFFDDERDIIVRLKEFLSKTFDSDHLLDNLNFIAQTLDSKKFERGTSAEQIIRDYFINDFYKEHVKIYQKRPIYWEFNSGRNKGFKALMYLHRYTPDQLAMVRHYLHELQSAMNETIKVDGSLLEQETTASAKSKYRRIIAKLNKQLIEMVKYDQILDHLSQQPVELDLDDGVLENHKKLQQGEKILSRI